MTNLVAGQIILSAKLTTTHITGQVLSGYSYLKTVVMNGSRTSLAFLFHPDSNLHQISTNV
jgi:hypothetical protein